MRLKALATLFIDIGVHNQCGHDWRIKSLVLFHAFHELLQVSTMHKRLVCQE